DELREDLDILQELGLNTLLVSHLDPAKDHHEALRLLAEKGFYIVVEIETCGREGSMKYGKNFPPNEDVGLEEWYTFDAIQRDFRLVDQLADYQNVLGFMVAGDCINRRQVTRFAPVLRAFVRDTKAFLRLRGGRGVPVGISNPCVMDLRWPALKYFTAGSQEERVDFFAPQDYSWCGPSSFKISGWENEIATLERENVCVPMFLAEFGCNARRERIWDEITCLYGKEMLGKYSGGCVYCFEEYGNGYGIVERTDEGVKRESEFETLKQRLQQASSGLATAMSGIEPQEYESWAGDFPSEPGNGRWLASSALPRFPGDLAGFVQELKDEREWDVVDRFEDLRLGDE
ncbi:glycoside hydrolase family 72 protein, partial [Cercospora zeae-maydis SCOH1-5]